MYRNLLVILFSISLAWAIETPSATKMITFPDGQSKVITQTARSASSETRDNRTRSPLDQGGDDCFSATQILSLPFCDSGTTNGHSNDYFHNCASDFSEPDVVYEFSPSQDMIVTFSLIGSTYDTYLEVWETDLGCDEAYWYECNGDYENSQSCITALQLYAGYTYYVVVDGENGESGSYILNIAAGVDCISTACGSGGGDTCEDPVTVHAMPYCDSRNTNNYSDDYFPECNNFACGERDVVYEFAPLSDMFLGISVTSTEFQPHVEIHETDTDCPGSYLYGCATINSGGNSCITGVDVYAGYRYYIYVDGHECGGDGIYTLNIYEGGGCSFDTCSSTGGNGETCANAIAVNSLPYHYSGSTAGMANDYDFCQFDIGAPDIVFSYIPTHTHLADILTCGSTEFESNLYIFRDGNTFAQFGECGIHPCYTFTSNYWPNAAMYCVEFEVGHSYCIVVDGRWSDSEGPFVLDISETSLETCSSGDLCDYPIVENEPNNSCSPQEFDVDTLFPGDTIAGIICDPGDVDLFYVVAEEDMWSLVGIQAQTGCTPGSSDLGISFVYPEYCGESDPCINCAWIVGCGPEVQAVRIAGLGSCYTGPYLLTSYQQPAPTDACDPVACQTATALACNTPITVNTCDGCASPICQTYRDGNSGPRGYTGPQKFYQLEVPATANYTVHVADDAQIKDVQFSIFTDCVLPRTTCVYAQDRNYWSEQPTGALWEETGTVALAPGTYFLHVSFANNDCGDLDVLVTCDATPCLPPDSVTVRWNTSSQAEIRFISTGGTYEIYSSNIPNNDGDPRGGDPQWSLRHSASFPAGQALWTDTTPTSDYRNYVVLQNCP